MSNSKYSPNKRAVGSDDTLYENLVKERDEEYYYFIKPYVDQIPDLLALEMKSSPAKKSITRRKWDNEAKWKSILTDLENLDAAVQRDPKEGKFDINFQEMINKDLGPWDMVNEAEVIRFVETHPYLSYILLRTEPKMKYYVLLAGKINWLSPDEIDSMAEESIHDLIRFIPNRDVAIRLDKKYNFMNLVTVEDIYHKEPWFLEFVIEKNLPVASDENLLNLLIEISDYTKIEMLLNNFAYPLIDSEVIETAILESSDESAEFLKWLLERYPDMVDPLVPGEILNELHYFLDPETKEYLAQTIEVKKLPLCTLGGVIKGRDITLLKRLHPYVRRYDDIKMYYTLIGFISTLDEYDIELSKEIFNFLLGNAIIIGNPNIIAAAVNNLEFFNYLESMMPGDVWNARIYCLNVSVRTDTKTVKYIIYNYGPFGLAELNTAYGVAYNKDIKKLLVRNGALNDTPEGRRHRWPYNPNETI